MYISFQSAPWPYLPLGAFSHQWAHLCISPSGRGDDDGALSTTACFRRKTFWYVRIITGTGIHYKLKICRNSTHVWYIYFTGVEIALSSIIVTIYSLGVISIFILFAHTFQEFVKRGKYLHQPIKRLLVVFNKKYAFLHIYFIRSKLLNVHRVCWSRFIIWLAFNNRFFFLFVCFLPPLISGWMILFEGVMFIFVWLVLICLLRCYQRPRQERSSHWRKKGCKYENISSHLVSFSIHAHLDSSLFRSYETWRI